MATLGRATVRVGRAGRGADEKVPTELGVDSGQRQCPKKAAGGECAERSEREHTIWGTCRMSRLPILVSKGVRELRSRVQGSTRRRVPGTLGRNFTLF